MAHSANIPKDFRLTHELKDADKLDKHPAEREILASERLKGSRSCTTEMSSQNSPKRVLCPGTAGLFKYLLAISVLTSSMAHAQAHTTNQVMAMVTASTTVVGNVDLILMRHMEFKIGRLSQENLAIDPQTDPRAGQIKIVGSPNTLVRMSYERESILRHVTGGSQLYFTYNLSGGFSIVQAQSTLITQNNQIRLSSEGVYYAWLGGRLSGTEDIVPGDYYLELTIMLEYIL